MGGDAYEKKTEISKDYAITWQISNFVPYYRTCADTGVIRLDALDSKGAVVVDFA